MREEIIKEWFQAWFNSKWNRFHELFESNVYDSESWGPEYSGIEEIAIWFKKWHSHSKLIAWDIEKYIHSARYTTVEWHFICKDSESKNEFDGCSIIEWGDNDKILSLREYSSTLPKYNPMDKISER